jgi:hypothetical protein
MEQDRIENGTWSSFFFQVPNCADYSLNLHEFRLFSHYLRVAGLKGTHFASIATIASVCNMGKDKVRESRKSLHEKGYIIIERVGNERVSYKISINFVALEAYNQAFMLLSESERRLDAGNVFNHPVPSQNEGIPDEVFSIPEQVRSVPNEVQNKNPLVRPSEEEKDGEEKVSSRMRILQGSSKASSKAIGTKTESRGGSDKKTLEDIPNGHVARLIVESIRDKTRKSPSVTDKQMETLESVFMRDSRQVISWNDIKRLTPKTTEAYILEYIPEALASKNMNLNIGNYIKVLTTWHYSRESAWKKTGQFDIFASEMAEENTGEQSKFNPFDR